MTDAAQSPKADLPADAFDALLPGGGDWPAGSACIPSINALAGLSTQDRSWLLGLSRDAGASWTETWRRAETDAPDRFGRVLAAVYDAYYRSEPVARRLSALAADGPRDPDQAFDPNLLDTLSQGKPP